MEGINLSGLEEEFLDLGGDASFAEDDDGEVASISVSTDRVAGTSRLFDVNTSDFVVEDVDVTGNDALLSK
jgi:hypothetical protein